LLQKSRISLGYPWQIRYTLHTIAKKTFHTVIVNIDIPTVTAKSFPCALRAVPFLFRGELGRNNGNASLVIIIIQLVQDAVKCMPGSIDSKLYFGGNYLI
jgi:hypothetical protein